MSKLKCSVTAFFGLVVLISVVWPRAGFGQNPSPNAATQLNCADTPCDAVARGRFAFNNRVQEVALLLQVDGFGFVN